jgi:AcrR family transcriptional regulator
VTDPATQRRVEQTCEKLLRDGAAATFTAVAAAAGVSRTTLYRDENLRAVVEEHRSRSHDPRTLSGLTTEVAHLRTAVEALADSVRQHDEQLRRLTARRKAN